jgi:AcrR family transcriptional regulator
MAPPNRIDRKRIRTRDHLAAVAHALFERHGYDAVTMEQIAAEADVARGTLYNHFPWKEALLAHAIHARLAEDLEPLLRKAMAHTDVQARLAGVMKASAQWWEAHRSYAAPYIRHRFQLLRDGEPGQADSDIAALYAHLIEQAQARGELRDDIDAEMLAAHLHFLSLGALLRWLESHRVRLTKEMAGALAFFMDGAAVRRP